MKEKEPSSLVLDSERRVTREQFMFENLGKLFPGLPSLIRFFPPWGWGETDVFSTQSL